MSVWLRRNSALSVALLVRHQWVPWLSGTGHCRASTETSRNSCDGLLFLLHLPSSSLDLEALLQRLHHKRRSTSSKLDAKAPKSPTEFALRACRYSMVSVSNPASSQSFFNSSVIVFMALRDEDEKGAVMKSMVPTMRIM